MNDLALEAAGPLMSKVLSTIMAPSVWAAQPLGHTETQIRRFILNEREHPRGAEKFRQIVRELWVRLEAYHQVKDRLDDLDIDELVARADLQQATASFAFMPWPRMRKDARIKKDIISLARIARARELIQLELRERIMRETLVLLDEAQDNAPSLDDAKAFTVEAEMKMWQQRAEYTPRLKELVGDGKGGH